MIDIYAWVSIVIRSIALTIMLTVAYRQYLLLKTKSDVQSIKYLLITLVFIVILNHIWYLGINLYRGDDGDLQTTVRQLSGLFNSISGLTSAIGWHVLYRRDK